MKKFDELLIEEYKKAVLNRSSWVTKDAFKNGAAKMVNAAINIHLDLTKDLLWFDEQRRLSIEYYSPMYGDDDDQDREWRVYEESGSINDREWDIVGRGQTVVEAISNARMNIDG